MMQTMLTVVALAVLTLPLPLAAQQASLYDRLGGRPAITAVVDDFVGRVAADPRINRKFERSHIPRVKAMLVEQVCEATGGPCTYPGRSMRDSHKGMKVSEGEFDAMVEQLVTSLTTFKVPQAEQGELLGALAAMKRDIVEVRGHATGTALPDAFVPAPPS